MKRQVARSKICVRLDRRIEGEVELVERLQFAELGRLHAAVDLPLLAHQQFVLQDQLQELGMAELVAGRFLQAHVERLGQARQSQLVEGGLQTIIHQIAPGQSEEGGTTVESSGETESGSAEEQPDKGYPDPGGRQRPPGPGVDEPGLAATAWSGPLLLSGHAFQNLRPRRGDPAWRWIARATMAA